MKRVFFILLLTSFFISCKKDKIPAQNSGSTNIKISNSTYSSTSTNLYRTEEGQILETTGEEFDLSIILSDKSNEVYQITDTLTSDDNGEARAVLKLGNNYHFSNTGMIEFNQSKNKGSFTITFGDTLVTSGSINVSSVKDEAIVDFTKITERDDLGFIINSDSSDWTTITEWKSVETLVFNSDLKNTSPYNHVSAAMYPNPFVDVTIFDPELPEEYKADVIILNKNFEVELSFSNQTRYSRLQINPDVPGNSYYRLYYKIHSGNKEYFGSGDLKAM